MKKKFELIAALACMMVLALALAGCGGGNSQDANTGGDNGSKTEAGSTSEGSFILADDDVCKIEVLSMKADWAGDPGYNLSIVNNADEAIYVSSEYGTWSVNGKMADPVLGQTVQPGKTAEVFMWFDSDEVGGVEDLVDVEGVIKVMTDDDWEKLASYDFKDVEVPIVESDEQSSSASSKDEESEAVEIGKVIADDDICTIEVVSSEADWAGDPGYNLSITNNTDEAIYVTTQYDTWSVNGKMADPYVGQTVQPGKSADVFMWFDSDEVGGVEDLVDVEGVIRVVSDDDWDELATYDFKI